MCFVTLFINPKAKFRIPRNVMNSKEFCSDYRPSAHMIGLYVPGIAECYFLTESDLKKDSSTNLTCLSRGLFLLKKILASRNLPLPENLVIQADNTSRETRNSIGLQYGAWLVGQQAFRNVDILFYRVGHTHNELDQRFSVAASLLSRAPVLQSLQDSLRIWGGGLRSVHFS